jgi:hypothetical protein
MNECKFCKEPELEWFFQENTSKYKLGRKMDDNVYIPHECKKIKPNKPEFKKKNYPIRYVSTMVMDFCKKHKIELTELKRCSECGLDKQCYYATVENKLLKYPYRFTIKDGKEIKDYDITIHDVIKNNLSN